MWGLMWGYIGEGDDSRHRKAQPDKPGTYRNARSILQGYMLLEGTEETRAQPRTRAAMLSCEVRWGYRG
jgi:hypothetical protein